MDSAELAVGFLMFHAAHVINDPHFSVTYLLFYRNVRDSLGNKAAKWQRFRYVFAGYVVPTVLCAWAASALLTGSAKSLGWMIQGMFFLVGWHYVKQGFGVLSVLSLRRGVHFTLFERRAVLSHCILGWLFARARNFDPGRESEEKGVVYTSFAHPTWLYGLTLAGFALSTCWLLLGLGRKWKREQRLPWAPLTGFLITVWVWVVFSNVDPLLIYVIPALHSLQYLYFVYLLRSNQAREEHGAPLFRSSPKERLFRLALLALGLGWLLFHGLPGLLDAALVTKNDAQLPLGATPYFAALFTIVNLHHYFMDSVIWRRDNPETRYLTL